MEHSKFLYLASVCFPHILCPIHWVLVSQTSLRLDLSKEKGSILETGKWKEYWYFEIYIFTNISLSIWHKGAWILHVHGPERCTVHRTQRSPECEEYRSPHIHPSDSELVKNPDSKAVWSFPIPTLIKLNFRTNVKKVYTTASQKQHAERCHLHYLEATYSLPMDVTLTDEDILFPAPFKMEDCTYYYSIIIIILLLG